MAASKASKLRQALVQGAIEMLDEAEMELSCGRVVTEPLSVRQLATRLRKSASAPIFHFPDRVSLLAAIASEGFQQLESHLRNRRTAAGSEPLLTLIVEYARWALTHPPLFRTMYDPALAPGVDLLMKLGAAKGSDKRRELALLYRGSSPAPASGSEELEALGFKRESEKRLECFEELFEAKKATLLLFSYEIEMGRLENRLRLDVDAGLAVRTASVIADGLAWQFVMAYQSEPDVLIEHARGTARLAIASLLTPPAVRR
jgi:AcrR family transcriptional regulator